MPPIQALNQNGDSLEKVSYHTNLMSCPYLDADMTQMHQTP
jgi:hypothetical protein